MIWFGEELAELSSTFRSVAVLSAYMVIPTSALPRDLDQAGQHLIRISQGGSSKKKGIIALFWRNVRQLSHVTHGCWNTVTTRCSDNTEFYDLWENNYPIYSSPGNRYPSSLSLALLVPLARKSS
ncbi:unnamed protein product [Diplocarpon coronariae]|nr:hypothetical protein JHW43_003839 [Diplocarpon mali]